jgi:hypothetical protein
MTGASSIYIISPKDGDTVTSPFRVQFGPSGMGVAPAGVESPNTGHHHLLIDADESLGPNEPIPQDKKHLHFGAGQTEALIELPPGKHSLQLVRRLFASSVPASPHVRCHHLEREVTGPTPSALFLPPRFMGDLSISFRPRSSLRSVLPHAGCARMWKWPLA